MCVSLSFVCVSQCVSVSLSRYVTPIVFVSLSVFVTLRVFVSISQLYDSLHLCALLSECVSLGGSLCVCLSQLFCVCFSVCI